jgi:hypothetical protein
MDYLNLYRELEQVASEQWNPSHTSDRASFAVRVVSTSALRLKMACELADTVGPYAEQYRDAARAIRAEKVRR